MPKDGIAESISDLASDTGRLVRLEIDLLKQELFELVKRNAIAAGMLLAAAVSAFLFLIFLLVWVVEFVPHHAWAAAGIAIAFVLGAGILAWVGVSRLKFAAPEKTIQSIQEDLEWVKQQIKPEPR
jgi:uncharacterized membrane protein YqjE